MLFKKNRLTESFQIRRVLKEGLKVKGGFLTLFFKENPRNDSAKITIIISQKTSKKAVLRNRLKRYLRADLRSRLSRINPKYDIVVLIGKVPETHKQISEDLENLLRLAKIYKDD
jgi:ribonuclease P protein component